MRINKDVIQKLNPCADRFNNYLYHYSEREFSLEDFIVLENITYFDKVWVVTRLFSPEQNIKWSILCASKVLSIFEEKYPGDNRPRKALEATEAYLLNPSQKNKDAAYAAYAAAHAAYTAAHAAHAAYAAYAAAHAAYAAYAAAHAVAYAVAYAAAHAADDLNLEEEVNLLLMLEAEGI